MQGAKFPDFAEGSPTEWLLTFWSRAADLGIAEENLAREAQLWLTGKAKAAYTQPFADYPYNTYPSFEMIASLLHQKFGAQYQAADVFHKFAAGARLAGSSGKAALLKVARDSQACREAGIPNDCSLAKQYYYNLHCQLSTDERRKFFSILSADSTCSDLALRQMTPGDYPTNRLVSGNNAGD